MKDRLSKKWFHFPRPNPSATMRLFCFHYAGGSAQVFHTWPGSLPSNLEVGMIQLPGRGDRLSEPYIRGLTALSYIAAQEFLPYLDKPFAFFGHSLGALLCFEIARSLRRENRRQPVHLFLSATEAPHCRKPEEPLSKLPKSALVDKLRELDGTPSDLLENDDLLDLLLPTLRADFELCESYEYLYESPLECSLTIYGGLEDPEVEAERLANWSELTVGASRVRMFPGGHFYLNTPEANFLHTLAGDLQPLCL